jgi:hypothetical protein
MLAAALERGLAGLRPLYKNYRAGLFR